MMEILSNNPLYRVLGYRQELPNDNRGQVKHLMSVITGRNTFVKHKPLTSRRIVKQQEQSVSPFPTFSVVGWKKFCVVFSNACTEKFSQ